jgi:hypothetical protein
MRAKVLWFYRFIWKNPEILGWDKKNEGFLNNKLELQYK